MSKTRFVKLRPEVGGQGPVAGNIRKSRGLEFISFADIKENLFCIILQSAEHYNSRHEVSSFPGPRPPVPGPFIANY